MTLRSEGTEHQASRRHQKESLGKTGEKIECRKTEGRKRRRGYGTLRPANFPTSILTALRISSPAVLVWREEKVGWKVGGKMGWMVGGKVGWKVGGSKRGGAAAA